jgi:hypothetical protein
MKDAIFDSLVGAEPIDALNALFSVVFNVAVMSGISQHTLNALFSYHIDAQFEIADSDIAEEDEDEEDENEMDEQTNN